MKNPPFPCNTQKTLVTADILNIQPDEIDFMLQSIWCRFMYPNIFTHGLQGEKVTGSRKQLYSVLQLLKLCEPTSQVVAVY